MSKNKFFVRDDVWNPMVKLMNNHGWKRVREEARKLLDDYNTASGIRIKKEMEIKLRKHNY